MILQILAAANFLLGAYDAYITQRRIKAFGLQFELNGFIKKLSTRMGPEIAAIIGILGPCVGWTYIFTYFNLPILLALLIGWKAKLFEIQLSSAVFEQSAREIQKRLNEFRASGATLPPGESTPIEAREDSKGK